MTQRVELRLRGLGILCLSSRMQVFTVASDLSLYSECLVTQRSSLLRLESDSAYPDSGLHMELRICVEIRGNSS